MTGAPSFPMFVCIIQVHLWRGLSCFQFPSFSQCPRFAVPLLPSPFLLLMCLVKMVGYRLYRPEWRLIMMRIKCCVLQMDMSASLALCRPCSHLQSQSTKPYSSLWFVCRFCWFSFLVDSVFSKLSFLFGCFLSTSSYFIYKIAHPAISFASLCFFEFSIFMDFIWQCVKTNSTPFLFTSK